MMPSRNATQGRVAHRAETALRAVLPQQVRLRTIADDEHTTVDINGVVAAVRWIGEGGLRHARELIARRPRRPTIVVARRMSPGARAALSDAGLGWVDETGAAEIALGTLIVARSGRPDPRPDKSWHWTPSVLAVAEALLCGVKATVASTAEATTLSPAAATHALRTLTELGQLAATARRGRSSARTLVDRDRLLDAYATAASALAAGPMLQVGVTWRDIAEGLREAGRKWQKAHIMWAATGAAAASVLAPYLTSVTTADVYVDAKSPAALESVAATAGLRPITGGRLFLRPFPTITSKVLASEVSGLRVAPWPRVFADLRTTGVRGEEAAEHLREVCRG